MFQRSSDKVALIYNWAEIIDEKGNLLMKSQSMIKGEVLQDILNGNFLPSPAVIVKYYCQA